MSGENKYLIVIAGPTAVGKTGISIKLAKQFDAEIISADSRQVFKEINIGTAKVTAEEMEKIPHHFIDIKHIDEEYSAGDYERGVLSFLEEYFKNKSVAILVGGTGLYIKAVLQGLDIFPEVPKTVLDTLETELSELGLESLQKELEIKDPVAYTRTDIKNPRRIVRALSIIRSTGKPFSFYQKNASEKRRFKSIPIVLELPREELYERINLRVETMMRAGLKDEVEQLMPFKEVRSLNTVGYKELIDYFDGKSNLDFAISKIKQHSRNYAKRQITWFNNSLVAKHFSTHAYSALVRYIEEEMDS